MSQDNRTIRDGPGIVQVEFGTARALTRFGNKKDVDADTITPERDIHARSCRRERGVGTVRTVDGFLVARMNPDGWGVSKNALRTPSRFPQSGLHWRRRIAKPNDTFRTKSIAGSVNRIVIAGAHR
jgi:hypothetical protein